MLLFFTGSSERKAEPEIRWIFGSAKISSGYFKERSLFASFSLSQIREKKKPFTYIAKQYFNQADQKKEDLNGKSSEWFNQKISEVDKHLERISLVKLQLTKNLKELESQGEGHLWIDHEFIDPALDTLKGSLAQVQQIENRMLVLKATYQDHQG